MANIWSEVYLGSFLTVKDSLGFFHGLCRILWDSVGSLHCANGGDLASFATLLRLFGFVNEFEGFLEVLRF